MKDVNYPLRKMYHSKLNTIVYNGIPIKNFYQKAPDNIEDENYIVYSGISNSDASSKQKHNTETSVNVTIHSFREKYNDGAATDAIAGLVMQALYPDTNIQADLSADGLQLVTTVLDGDTLQTYNIQGSREYVDRVLIFKHRIFQQ